jgi:transcriptional regulator with XRE-family HTH domain
MDDFAARVRQALNERGMSIRGAAKQLNYDCAYLSRVLSRKQQPSLQLAIGLDKLLGTQGALARLATGLNPNEGARLMHGLRSPARIDAETVEALARMFYTQQRLDDTLGSTALMTPTLIQVETIQRMISESKTSAPPDVVRRLCSVAAEWVRFAGWLHAAPSQRMDSEAMTFFSLAEELADEARDPAAAALAVSFRGYVARQRGNWRAVIRASFAARESPGSHHTQRTFDTLQAAQGYAGLAQELLAVDGVGAERHIRDSRKLLDSASSMIDQMVGDKGTPPDSVYWYSAAFFRMNIGMALYGLGAMSEAVQNLKAGLEGFASDYRTTEWAREYTETLALAEAAS